MTQFLSKESDIIAWLNTMGITACSLVKNKKYGFVVNVGGDVRLVGKELGAIPVKFGVVNGNFSCKNTGLTSLLGAPDRVRRDFSCDFNLLESLQHAPKEVGRNFVCSFNRLKSLEYSPQQVHGNFYARSNRLTSLEHGPERVEGSFSCSDNLLLNLEFCPKIVGGNFSCKTNQINTLAFMPSVVGGGKFLCIENPLLGEVQTLEDMCDITPIYLQHKEINEEKKRLTQAVQSQPSQASQAALKTHKI